MPIRFLTVNCIQVYGLIILLMRLVAGGRGRPLQVVVANEPYQFALNTAALKQIFQDPRVVDSKVAILSVAGSCRHGKSFLLNFFLKYLRAQVRDQLLIQLKTELWSIC